MTHTVESLKESFTQCRTLAIASGAYESYKGVGESFDALHTALTELVEHNSVLKTEVIRQSNEGSKAQKEKREALAERDGLQAKVTAMEAAPTVQPLTQSQVVEEFCKLKHNTQYVTVFDAGVRFAEKHHKIKEQTP